MAQAEDDYFRSSSSSSDDSKGRSNDLTATQYLVEELNRNGEVTSKKSLRRAGDGGSPKGGSIKRGRTRQSVKLLSLPEGESMRKL